MLLQEEIRCPDVKTDLQRQRHVVVVLQLEDKFMHEKRRPSDVPADAVKTLHSHSYQQHWTISQEVSSIAVLSTYIRCSLGRAHA